MRRTFRLLLVLSGLLIFILCVWQTGIFRYGTPRIQRVKSGMTINKVESVLGKPEMIMNMPSLPAEQIRIYFGDGDHRIRIWFKNGVATSIEDDVPRRNWPPIG